MNDSPKDSDKKYKINLQITKKTISTPARKQEIEHSLPKTTKELREMFDEFIKYQEMSINEFNNILLICKRLITKKLMKYFFEKFIDFYKKDILFFIRPFMNLIEIIDDPNLIINLKDNEESILMTLCDISHYDNNYKIYEMISALFKKKINVNVNYEDKLGRNALFYLNGGKYDENIIKLLVENKIKIDHKDKNGNTALYHIINNDGKKDLIYNLINIGNANFMIKNNQNISCLELINNNWISKKNLKEDALGKIYNFAEIKKIIQLIKKKLSLKISENNLPQSTELNLPSDSHSQNLYKMPSLTFNKNINEIQKNNDETMENSFYLSLKKNPSLIINTSQFEERKNNNLSFSQKIERYKQANKNKKIFLNFLINSENYLRENAAILKATLEEKKKELEEKKKELALMQGINKDKYNVFDIELKNKSTKIYETQIKIKKAKKELSKNIIKIKEDSLYMNKFENLIDDKKKDYNYIYFQLTKDINEYFLYVNKKNMQLNTAISQIIAILENSIRNVLGEEYILNIYGSRASGMCLPWSDIDCVIVAPPNYDTSYRLQLLYDFLKLNPIWKSITYIGGTQVPIIKIKTREEYHNIAMDISMEFYSHHGLQCVKYIRSKAAEYPPLTAMTLALKTIFYNAHINEPYNGGLSSYGIILLIIYFLKIKRNQGEDISMNNVGKLFFELLLFYENKKNINKTLIIEENVTFPPYMTMFNTNSLVIVDPLDSSNNVAKNARDLNKILYTFQVAVSSIFDNCECGCHYQRESSLKEMVCSHNLLNKIFNATKNVEPFNFNAWN